MVLIKANTVVRAPVSSLVDCSIDFEARASWDKTLYDFKTFSMSADRTVGRVSYTFKSPVAGFADRDFYLQQLIRWDYPTPGAVTMHVSSLEPSDELPINP